MVYSGFILMPGQGGDEYTARLAKQLERIVDKRFTELEKKEKLSFEEKHFELPFIEYIKGNGAPIGSFNRRNFKEGEMNRPVNSDVRGKDVYLIQSHITPNLPFSLSENLIETSLCIDSLRHAVAKNITLLSLYLPYSRGDKQTGRDGIPAALLARQWKAAGLDRLISMDLHAEQIIGYFHQVGIKTEQIRFSPLLIHYLQHQLGMDFDVLSPDVGGGKRAEFYAENLHTEMIQAYKQRDYRHLHAIKKILILGEPGPNILAIDDIINSGNTMLEAIREVAKKGTAYTTVAGTHLILSGNALDNFDASFANTKSSFKLMIGSDSIPHDKDTLQRPYLIIVDTTGYIGQTIYNLQTNRSISNLHTPCCVGEQGLWVGTNKNQPIL